jgi:hypothetical protein
MKNYFTLEVFPKYACDDNGFLYRKHGIEYYKPLKPKRHGFAGQESDFRFYITVNAKKYSCSQSDLKSMKTKVFFRMEK